MSEQSLWGVLIILYVIPAGIYLIRYLSEESVTDGRKKLYPGSVKVIEEERKRESRFTKFLALWGIGFGLLLIGYTAEWNPIGTVIFSLGVSIAVLAIYSGVRSKFPSLMASRSFRFWLAGSVVWILAVWSWYLVFGSHSELNEEEYALSALMPTLISAVGVVVWRWARKP